MTELKQGGSGSSRSDTAGWRGSLADQEAVRPAPDPEGLQPGEGDPIVVMRLAMSALTIVLVAVVATSALVFLPRHGSSPPRVVSPRDAQRVRVFEANLRAATSLDNRPSSPTYGDFIHSLDSVIAVARSNPGALYTHGGGRTQTLRQVLSEAAWRLGAFEPSLSAKLLRTLEETEQ